MAHHHTSRSSSLTSLSEEISGLYTSYTKKNSGYSPENSLDSSSNEPAVDIDRLYPNSPHTSHTGRHVSGYPTLRQHFAGIPLPESENSSSALSFDLIVHDSDHQATSSSLNVLLDTPMSTKDRFISSTSLADSSRSLDPMARQNSQAVATEESLGSYKNYDEKLNEGDWAERDSSSDTTSNHTENAVIRRTVEDFEFGKDLGEGSYSTVVLAKDKITGVRYAVKILDKRHIIKEKKVKYVNIEKHALNRLSQTQGVISLFFTFQDTDSLYFVLDFAANGELLGLIKKYGTLNEDCTRYLGAQILDAINHMHINGVIHRDIKPENILLDDKCRIRITDFGTAKLLERKVNGDTGAEEDYPLDVRAKSFVGTAEYVSPELLENKYCGKPGDLWAFGCILYQMIAGKPPFKATNEYLTFQKITKLQYAFSAGFPLILRDLIKQILVLQPSRRATIEEIQDHYFFHPCDFSDPDSIWNTEIPELSPYKMTAQSMMKIPASQTAKKKVIRNPIKKPQPQAKPKSQVQAQPRQAQAKPSTPQPQPQISKQTQPKAQSQNGTVKRNDPERKRTKDFSAASVAAYVLAKDEDVEAKSKTPKSVSQPRRSATPSHSTPDYIPGTNILRPQINKMPSYSLTNSTSSSKSDKEVAKRKASRVIEITPPTAVEAAWQQYLSPSERVIHVGSATVRRLATEVFEKKNKGYIHDTPLGFNSRLQSIANRSTSRSMLSHVVQGNRMRDANENSTKGESHNEEDAINYHFQEPADESESTHEDEEEKHNPVTSSSSRLGKSLFKKFLPIHDKKQDSSNESSTSGSSDVVEKRQVDLLEKVRSYTVLVSTFGRVLLFLRDDHKTDYKLVCEIGLNFPFIQFKEVVSSSSGKFGKMIPSTGIFAIVVLKSTFVFETEKYEVSQWTEALAKSKLNQFEREKEADQKRKSRETPVSSPRLLDSPAFPSPVQRQPKKQDAPIIAREQSPQYKQSRSPVPESKENPVPKNEARNTVKIRMVRKAPPSLPSSPHLGGGVMRGHDQGDSGTVHAAQLAVLNSPLKTSSENRRSSFSRDRNGHTTPSTTAQTSGGGKVTTMNSKFLARSRGKK